MYLITVQDLDDCEYFLLTQDQWFALPPETSPADSELLEERTFDKRFESAMEMLNYCVGNNIMIEAEDVVLSVS